MDTTTPTAPPTSHAAAPPLASWGPLAGLIGTWEGDEGEDLAFSHARGDLVTTPYRESVTSTPLGPVHNGRQSLMGLDFRSAMWRGDDELPFHTEVGYWLWDSASGEVLRGFVLPRGVTVLAGAAVVAADVPGFAVSATLGDQRYGISQGAYLGERASVACYRSTLTLAEGSWAYDTTTTLDMAEIGRFADTDRNRLRRVQHGTAAPTDVTS